MFDDRGDGSEFSVTLEVVDDEQVIVVSGEVDLSVTDRLWGCMAVAIAAGGPVVLDLQQVTFIDSSGLNLLGRAHHDLGDRPELVVVRRPSPQVSRVLEMSGVGAYVTVVPAGGVSGSDDAASDGSGGSGGGTGRSEPGRPTSA